MVLKIYQVDAFTSNLFEGNPAAVVPLEQWLPDEIMQKIAFENNLSETAFFIPVETGYYIRWFTPGAEVRLCGHATLASAHVLYEYFDFTKNEIIFDSKSGLLKVKKEGDYIIMNFPASQITEIEIPENLKSAFNYLPQSCFKGRDDLMLVFENESEILNLKADFKKIADSNTRGIIVTAKSKEFDFVSRFFAPAVGVNEDPVTGSAHTMLIPYWSNILGKNEMIAKQVSKRGGKLKCNYVGDRVEIGGKATTYLIGEIFI